MISYLDEAQEELKRVDHLIYVSLKYTRTVDVLLNSISRIIDAYDFMFMAIIEKGIADKDDAIPKTPIERGNFVKDLYPDDQQIHDNVELFFLLRKIHRSPNPQKTQEYRRHVALTVYVDGREEIVNIDIITQYYHFQKEFFDRLKILLAGE